MAGTDDDNCAAVIAALLRLLREPVLRRGMGVRAIDVARRHYLEATAGQIASAVPIMLDHAGLSAKTSQSPSIGTQHNDRHARDTMMTTLR